MSARTIISEEQQTATRQDKEENIKDATEAVCAFGKKGPYGWNIVRVAPAFLTKFDEAHDA
jgi:hypothetical protein